MPPAKKSPATKRPGSASAPPKGAAKRTARRTSARGLVVAVTGPTGEIGRSFVSLLDRSPQVAAIRGMARSPFDAAAHGWTKVDYHQGDILDRAAVDHLVAGADVVVHLAFIVLAAGEGSRDINLEGSRNVFEAAAAAGARRLVYTSSVAAYGFSEELPDLLTEDTPAIGFERHPYSAQKAEVERELHAALAGSKTAAYVFRPCIVAGPDAPVLVNAIPFVHLGERLPRAVRELFDQVSVLKPVLPDPGTPFQLVHHDDVAAALCAGVLGTGAPGVYNLAAEGEFTFADLARELGWYSIPVPDLTVDATAEVIARLPFLPDEATWIQALRRPVLMDTSRAREELRWRPRHDTLQTLHETVTAWRAALDATDLAGADGR